MVEVEKARGVDLLAPAVFQQLLSWAGLVGAVVGAPPCRTASQFRSHDDGARPPSKIAVSHDGGLPDLKKSLQAIVQEDNALWLRFLLLYGSGPGWMPMGKP